MTHVCTYVCMYILVYIYIYVQRLGCFLGMRKNGRHWNPDMPGSYLDLGSRQLGLVVPGQYLNLRQERPAMGTKHPSTAS